MSAKNGAVPQELLALAQKAAAPQLRETALERRFGPRSSWVPTEGQLWRAGVEDVTALVVLTAVDPESVTVVPVSVDGGGQAADVVVVDGTVLGVPIVIWAGLRRMMPMSVLDRPVDDLGPAVLSRIADRALATDTSTALMIDDVRAELLDDLDLLAERAVDSVRAAAPAVDAATGTAAGIDLDAIDPADLDEAAVRLGVPLPVVLDLIDGKRPATLAEAGVLRDVLGGAPETAPSPQALVVELAQPRWRNLVRQHRARRGVSEAAARTAMAYNIDSMAARQTGEREPSWPDRIRLWAQGEQLDPDADA